MNPLVSTILVLMIAVVVISLVLSAQTPLVDRTIATSKLKESEDVMTYLNNYARDVRDEGIGSKRKFNFMSPGDFEIIPVENAIQFEIHAPLFEDVSRKFSNNMVYVVGSDVDCYEADADNDGDTDLVMENRYLKAAFQRIAEAAPFSSIDTKDNILQLTDKTNSMTIAPANSSIVIDNDLSTSAGTGYSKLSRKKKQLPVCVAHFYINSTLLTYDIFYKLYAGADFLVIEVRNIKETL